MTSIVEQLRAHGGKTAMEAAAELERLRAEQAVIPAMADEIERLEGGIKQLRIENNRLAFARSCLEGTISDKKAEIERLRCDLDAMERKRNTASVSLMKAIAENERLCSKLDEYRLETERLRDRVTALSHPYSKVAALEYGELEGEVERLRAENKTLQLLVDGEFGFVPPPQKGS